MPPVARDVGQVPGANAGAEEGEHALLCEQRAWAGWELREPRVTFGASILVRGTLRLEPFVLLPDAGRSRGRHKGPVRAAAGAHAAHHCPRRGTLQPPKAEHVEGKCALSRANANAALSQQPVARDARGPQVRPPLSTRSRRSRVQTATMRLPLTAARSTDPRVSGVG